MSIFSALLEQIPSIQWMMLVLTVILHIVFAGAVAKDAGELHKRGIKTHLVSPTTWALAVLLGGPIIAIGYWFMHHLKPYK